MRFLRSALWGLLGFCVGTVGGALGGGFVGVVVGGTGLALNLLGLISVDHRFADHCIEHGAAIGVLLGQLVGLVAGFIRKWRRLAAL